jgi:hypothetical protein
MKLYISKLLSTILPIVGVLCILVFACTGDILYGWILFVVLSLLSGLINTIFFRCPHCHKSIPANSTVNQKYCPLCGEDLGMKPFKVSYYGKCKVRKDGTMKVYTLVAPMVFVVSLFILFLIVVAVFGMESITKGMGRIALAFSVLVSLVLAFFCRVVVSSVAKLDDSAIYYSKLPFKWRRYELEEIRQYAEKVTPFYHVTKGYVFATSKGLVAIPMASYAGGQEFFTAFTQKIGQPMPDVKPEFVMSRKSEEFKEDADRYAKAQEQYKEIAG